MCDNLDDAVWMWALYCGGILKIVKLFSTANVSDLDRSLV